MKTILDAIFAEYSRVASRSDVRSLTNSLSYFCLRLVDKGA